MMSSQVCYETFSYTILTKHVTRKLSSMNINVTIQILPKTRNDYPFIRIVKRTHNLHTQALIIFLFDSIPTITYKYPFSYISEEYDQFYQNEFVSRTR